MCTPTGPGLVTMLDSRCAFLKEIHYYRFFCYKLNCFNSVFQAEMAAINFATSWALERNVKIKVFSDSKSSIEAIRSPKVKSNFVSLVKKNLYNAKDPVSFVWVKAHAGNQGNQLADTLKKIILLVGPICLYLLLILM
ncbi:hypothetical protein AVEN_92935-1 [Araneus ventricosus]|uniref:RNase H type-1 domain-containing protein n=1 Tax=Araneus ventricosus TaxID=182803 RepID=A0A4Y2D091_ARAVE|nr:hypothetical protein AVEN_92935-1 [Araneus ventricosus]